MKKPKFITTPKEDGYYHKVDNQVFLVSINDKENKSCGALIPVDFDIRGFIEEYFNKSITSLGCELDEMILKVVGPEIIVQKIKSYIPDIIKETKFVIRENGFELLYFPQTGQVRITKAVEKNPISTPEIQQDKNEVKVLIVEDSPTLGALFKKVFSSDPDIQVCDIILDPTLVKDAIEKYNPTVITLDIQMPKMNGLEVLRDVILPEHKIPTIMVSSLNRNESEQAIEALEMGAFDYFEKPTLENIEKFTPEIIECLKAASTNHHIYVANKKVARRESYQTSMDDNALVLIGSSTGGTNALKEILMRLPDNIPPILIVQHIPPIFSKAFAERMNSLCEFEVKEAENGETVKKNTVYIAPGDHQMKLHKKELDYTIETNKDPHENRFRPSVDYFFRTTKEILPSKTLAIMLTGMGRDGSKEMKQLHDLGVATIAQDEASSTVYGMPKAVVELNAADHVLHLVDIPKKMVEILDGSYNIRNFKKSS